MRLETAEYKLLPQPLPMMFSTRSQGLMRTRPIVLLPRALESDAALSAVRMKGSMRMGWIAIP